MLYPSTAFVECDNKYFGILFLLFIHPFLCLVDYDFVYNMLKLYTSERKVKPDGCGHLIRLLIAYCKWI